MYTSIHNAISIEQRVRDIIAFSQVLRGEGELCLFECGYIYRSTFESGYKSASVTSSAQKRLQMTVEMKVAFSRGVELKIYTFGIYIYRYRYSIG